MKKSTLKVVLCCVLLICIIACSIFFLNNQKNDYYAFDKQKLTYNDIFYSSNELSYDVYGIGLFHHFDALELKEDSDLLEFYNETDTRTFDVETLNEFFGLLKKCTYISLDKNEADKICRQFKEENKLTSIDIATDMFFSDNPWFSEEALEVANKQVVGLVSATVYELNGEGYIVADLATYVEYNEFRGYEMPSFSDASTTVIKIEKSDAFNTIIERKSDFSD